MAKSTKPKYHLRPDGLMETTRTDPRTKKRIHFYGHTAQEIDRQILEYTSKQERGRLFQEVAKEWWDEHSPTLAYNTLKSYKPAYLRAVEQFGKEPIRSIRPQDIKGYLNDFARGGRAKKTVTTQLNIINMICAHAVESGDIDFSPSDHVTIPKGLKKTRREAATPEEEAKVKASADIWLFPYLLLYTGLRLGEALALTREDFDFKKNTISVTKSVYFESNQPKLKCPKTEAGTRTVPLLAPLLKKLPKRWKGYLFSEDGGKTPYTRTQLMHHQIDYKAATGVTASPHQLRHSFATMLYEFNVELKDAQDILGHSTAAMTQDIYTHIRETRRKETAAYLDKMLSEADQVS